MTTEEQTLVNMYCQISTTSKEAANKWALALDDKEWLKLKSGLEQENLFYLLDEVVEYE